MLKSFVSKDGVNICLHDFTKRINMNEQKTVIKKKILFSHACGFNGSVFKQSKYK